MSFLHNKKSQISVEFLFAAGLIVFIFIGLLVFNFDRKSDLRDTEQYLKEQNLCLKLASLMTSLYVNGDGSNFVLKVDYDASINPNSRSITIEEDEGYCVMPFDNYPSKDLEKGNTYYFKNNNNYINIENS